MRCSVARRLRRYKAMQRKNTEIKAIFIAVTVVFSAFLLIPAVRLLIKSFYEGGFTTAFYSEVLTQDGFGQALLNSFAVSGAAACLATVIAFALAYAIHYTGLPAGFKRALQGVATLPMFLPTITYGFAIIYSFGKQGLITRLLGFQLFDIYGFQGLLLGYVIYTVPVAFLLIHNTMGFIDKKTITVSKLMGDSPFATFRIAVLRPLLGTLAGAFLQSFFLCFTDFGIPASVGGRYEVIATVLYNQMLGAVPDFNKGAVVAMVMLLPSILSIALLQFLERFNIRYNRISAADLRRNPARDTGWGVIGAVLSVAILAIFAVIFVVPMVEEWPYQTAFTTEHITAVLQDSELFTVYKNSLFVALLTALFGTLIAYGAALIAARSTVHRWCKQVIEAIALITNTIPGMVLGLAFLFSFSGTSLQNTFTLMIVCNIIHFFSTPYLMMKNALSKMNAGWETTARLMGDSWIKTITRVVTPNAASSLLEVFSYYFINAMVTVSALIFIAGARTMVITTKIKQLQYVNKFNEVFVLSLLILFTNLIARAVFSALAHCKSAKKHKKERKLKPMKRIAAMMLAGVIAVGGCASVTGCSSAGAGEEAQVIIYSNADDEAVTAMKNALDANGYEGQYTFQIFGTSELGGKLLAEGTNLEADLVTMSTFYTESAQEQNNMFLPLTFDVNTIDEFPDYCAPITSQEGAIIVNTEVLAENNLPMPTCIKDLADPVYKDMVSVTDIQSSSTAWLLIQALISEYGEDGAKDVLTDIYANAGDHIESSGSGPLKKCRAGEVAVGFGLRQQAVADKADGLPIDYVDPTEGNFSLTESVSVLDKGEDTNPKAMEMAQCIIENGRAELQTYYPNALYEGEETNAENKSAYPKTFPEKLTVDLLQQHQALSESCK